MKTFRWFSGFRNQGNVAGNRKYSSRVLRAASAAAMLLLLVAAAGRPVRAQTFTTLLIFDGTDGGYPYYGTLIQGTDGNIYGTTSGGGAHNDGTVFKITASGTLTTLYSFCSQSNCADGFWPYAGLVQATNGNFYGTTISGGVNGQGTVFEITPAGVLTTLYSFCSQTNCTDGENPYAGLIQATNGNLYGTTAEGGAYGNYGTVFQITTAGQLTTLYSFCSKYPCDDGESPYGGLVQATNGNFYGTTDSGGADGSGTVYEITPAGVFTTLYSFTGGADGSSPYGETLVQADNGNFYGTTYVRGAKGGGTVFEITPGGQLTTLYTFCSQTDCTDGRSPQSGLVLATDGNFYGTTTGGGANGYGSVFEITPAGELTTLHSFDWTDGEDPRGGLMQASNGIFYGTTTESETGYGTVFSLTPTPTGPAITSAGGATFTVLAQGSFLVTTTGYPIPALAERGTLPSGVTFTDNGNGTGTLGGTAAPGTVGTYDITFSAQNGVPPNATQNFTLTISKAGTSTALAALPNPANTGQSVTLTASVTVNAPGSGSPTGTVSFYDSDTALACSGGNQILSAGQATCQLSFAATGSQSLTATYSGDASFTSSTGGTSLSVVAPPPPTVVQVVDNETITVADREFFADVVDAEKISVTDTVLVKALLGLPTSIRVSVLPANIVYPGPVKFAASVTSSAGYAVNGGAVTFVVTQANQSGCPLTVPAAKIADGTATSDPVQICSGSYHLSASYSGDISFATSRTADLSPFVVNRATTSVTLTSSAETVAGGAVMFTAKVKSPASATPTGSVSFLIGSANLGTAPLANGVATLENVHLPVGHDEIAATYDGNTNFNGSTSARLTVNSTGPQQVKGFTFLFPVDYPGAGETDVLGINDSGTLAGFYKDAMGTHGFSGSLGSMKTFDVPFPSVRLTAATGINNAGIIVGRYLDGAGEHGFKDAAGTFTAIDFPVRLSFLTQSSTDALGINDSGNIVGVYVDASGVRHGFLDQAGTMTTVDVGSQPRSTVNFGINEGGAIVSTFADDAFGIHGYVNQGPSEGTINYPYASTTQASGIDNRGDTVGFYLDSGGSTHGYVDQGGGNFTRVDVPGATSTEVLGINNSSSIVGIYTDVYGTHGFEATAPFASLIPAKEIVITESGLVYNHATSTYSEDVKISNISVSPINGPLQIVLEGLNAGIQLVNASGKFDTWPYITAPGVESLAPGQSSTVTLQFKILSDVKGTFTPVVYSGSF